MAAGLRVVMIFSFVFYSDYKEMQIFNKYQETNYTYDEWFWGEGTIKEYHELRSKEFELKIKLYRQIKTLLTEIRRLQKNLPKLEIPKILKKPETKEIIPKEKHYEESIESQLREIQEKLNSLGTNNF